MDDGGGALLLWGGVWAGLLAVLLVAMAIRAVRGRGAPAAKGVPGPEAAPAEGSTDRVRRGLARSRSALATRLGGVLGGGLVDRELRERLEEALIESDVGVRTAEQLLAPIDRLPAAARDAGGVRSALRDELRKLLGPPAPEEELGGAAPAVILIVGVNGVGKTTTIGKLAARHHAAGRSVLVVAGDTFRAAAVDQLSIWAERTGAQIVRQELGTDPSAVVFDGMSRAVARRPDVVLIDTAGRLHTKTNLMEELRKVRRTIERVLPGAPHEVLLVLDATTGQNALAQARTFADAIGVTGVVLTKLDGSARGGMAVAVRAELGVPIRYVGLGEGVNDLQPFDPEAFLDGLLPAE
jgi:fused signal recognition particle receptor